MKRSWPSFLGSMLIAVSAAALSPSVDTPQDASQSVDPAQRDLGGNAERRLSELQRQAQAGKLELQKLSQDADAAHARTVTRGHVYVRLAKAGLLPVGGGFEAFVEHAVHLERLRNAIGRDVALERELNAQRIALGRKLMKRDPTLDTGRRSPGDGAGADCAALGTRPRRRVHARILE